MRRVAWVLAGAMAATGCVAGDQQRPELEGDGSAAGPDSRQRVTMQFVTDGPAVAGLTVFFQDERGQLVLETRTDADGKANARMESGGYATLVLQNGQIFTYAGIEGGETYVVDGRSSVTGAAAQISLMAPPNDAGNAYVLSTGCGETVLDPIIEGMPVKATLYGCYGLTDALITSRNTQPAPFGSNWRYLYQPNVVIDPLTPMVMDGEWRDMVEAHVNLAAMPRNATKVVTSQWLARDQRTVTDPRYAQTDLTDSGDAVARLQRSYVPEGATTVTRVQPVVMGPSMQSTLAWGPSAEEIDLNLGAVNLSQYTSLPTLDTAAHRIEWTETNGAHAQLQYAAITWSDADRGAMTWNILTPRGAEAGMTLPQLPGRELQPPTTAKVVELAAIGLSQDSTARTTLLGQWPGNDSRFVDIDVGRVDIVQLNPN
ncbi:MAG TPA: hypothetical protein VGM39_11600 [Kofleriaceae bacterium]